MVRHAREEHEGGKPMLSLSQEALAEMVGLTRKTVNGYFADFEREGLIRRTYASSIPTGSGGLPKAEKVCVLSARFQMPAPEKRSTFRDSRAVGHRAKSSSKVANDFR
jgi:DNA-binding XRE family transcriptional regulator